MSAGRPGSLATRLVWLFVAGSALLLAAAGYVLYHALAMRLEANDLAEMRGKTAAIEATLAGVRSGVDLDAALERLRDLPVGHPGLAVGVREGEAWLVPLEGTLAHAMAGQPAGGDGYDRVEARGRVWLVHRVRHAPPATGPLEVVLAVEVTDTLALLREHALATILVALLGTAASALLAWFVARRGLAPIARLADRAGEVTARRLGERLDAGGAPRELAGLAEAVNRMLERLEESFHALEQFSGDIAHELRTPINNLLLQTQVTLSRPREAAEYVDALHSNLEELERLQRMVSDMLFLARADRGMIELTLEEIDLRPEVDSVAEYFEAAAAERGQRIVVRGEGRVSADRLLVRRALNNLLSNAVRYSPEGATIETAIACGARDCEVVVANPGEAIPPEELSRLFARFARRDVARGRELEGAGLGLAIVESIMKLQGGSVAATSAADAIRFALRFPRAAT